jgi:cytochrome c2
MRSKCTGQAETHAPHNTPLQAVVACPIFTLVLLLAGCGMSSAKVGSALTGGDPHRGVAAINRYGCGSCHTIGGITSAHGLVGPPLTGLRDRMYVAGILPNTPDDLIHWIRDPKTLDPKTAMPSLGVTQHDATDIAAYIYSIP